MKRLLICLVALIAVFALVMPASAAEMKVNGIFNAKANAQNNFNGDDDTDDASQYVTQRFRSYWNWIASENLKLVYKNEIDMEWGDEGNTATRGSGGGLGGDAVNLETKNIYLEFMVPDTPVKTTLGLQGITLHKGWFISDDAGGARFDMNFDPVSITAYWIGVDGLEANDTVSSNDNWQAAVSGAYKAENLDARLSLAYQRNPNDLLSDDEPESDDLYLLMGEFGMSFDMVSFNIVAATNFGEVDSDDNAQDRDYEGFMFAGNVDFALDMATISVSGAYVSGDKEGDLDEDFQGLAGQTFSWAEIISDGYTYHSNASLAQIGAANKPSNMYYVAVGVDLKPTDTTTLMFDVYYVGMVEDRTIAGEEEDEIGVEIDARLVQKVYDNLSLTLLGAYLLAEDGYGVYDPDDPNAADNSGDDAFQVVLGMDFKF